MKNDNQRSRGKLILGAIIVLSGFLGAILLSVGWSALLHVEALSTATEEAVLAKLRRSSHCKMEISVADSAISDRHGLLAVEGQHAVLFLETGVACWLICAGAGVLLHMRRNQSA